MVTRQFGLQLYTLRDAVAEDLPDTLRKISKMGYAGVEFAGFAGYSAAALQELLDELGMQSLGAHTDFYELRDNLQGVVDFHRVLGTSYVICPFLEENLRDSKQKCLEIAHLFDEWGQALNENGMSFGYHNHWFEFEEDFDGELLYDTLVSCTDSTNVKLELDVCWAQHAGQDPVKYMEKYADRIPLLHLKDLNLSGAQDVLTVPLGEGNINLPAILNQAENMDVKWFVVEQDYCQYDAFTSVANSLAWLTSYYSK